MSTTTPVRVCPQCKAEYKSQQGRCWLCGEPLPEFDAAPIADPLERNPYRSPSSAAGGSTFALSTLFLIITLIAVCLGVIGVAPGLGVPLVLVVTLALVRTTAASRREKHPSGHDAGWKVVAFFESAAIVMLVLLAAAVAFGAACGISCGIAVSNPNGAGFAVLIIGTLIGVLAAIILTVVLLRATWPGRKNKPDYKAMRPPDG